MLYILIIILLLVVWRVMRAHALQRQAPPPPMSHDMRVIMESKVQFYSLLSESDRKRFEERVMRFLADVRITGVSAEVTVQDRVLVAASAVIPIFGFPEWRYRGLREVLLYPSSFNEHYAITGAGRDRLGQVG
ncbi:MAG: zinc-dependent peptidase, partial [Flavobacteriales bacterium]